MNLYRISNPLSGWTVCAATLCLLALTPLARADGPLTLDEHAIDETSGNLECFKISTPIATYWLDKVGAGFSRMEDQDGNDWIGFHPEPGSGAAGEWRGFPNAVYKEAGNYFHATNAATDRSITKVRHVSNDRVTITAESGNGLWGCQYDFFPTHCTFTMTRMPPDRKYWVLYEGIPGGQYDDDDWWITSAIQNPQPLTKRYEGHIPSPTWIAFGDKRLNRVLYVYHHEDDEHPDYFYQMQQKMTVFGFGRRGLDKFLESVPQQFSIGFIESTRHETISQEIREHHEAPYPPSPVIIDFSLDWSTHRRGAPGSDNFQLTWADDDNQYGWWGDGGGFGGTNSDGRVGLGFARIEGDASDWKGYNVWGGKDPENPAQFDGKSWGTISVDGALYSWIVPDVPDTGGPRDHYRYIELARSTDHGASWTKADWRWQVEDDLIVSTFLNFGKDNDGARDEYVYSYFIRPQSTDITQLSFGLNVHKPGAVFLARVHKDRLFAGRDHYAWFAGMHDGEPKWGDLNEKQPVFEDANGTGWCLSASYNPGLSRYLLATEHTHSHVDNLLGIFDAPEPWGPWTTVKYWTRDDRFGEIRKGSDLDWNFNVFFLAFAPKWLSDDGRTFTLTFTGGGRGKDNDSFNTLRGRFELRQRD